MTIKNDLSQLAARLRRARESRGLGQRETAHLVAVSAAFLCRLENPTNNATPSEALLWRLAKLLGEDLDTLMHLAGRVSYDILEQLKTDASLSKFLRGVRCRKLTGDQLLPLLDS
mgnify:CR=1 FL=1